MKLNNFFYSKPAITETINSTEFKEILKVFLPIAKKIIGLDKLPTIILKKTLPDDQQPTQGRFHNSHEFKLELAIANRQPVDILRTLAHELVHARQHLEKTHVNGETGSPDENEAHIMAGVVMREFNKLHPEFLKFQPVSEGGNLAIGGQEAQHIDLKVTNRSFIVPILNKLLAGINQDFASKYKTPLWEPKLLKSGEFLSGSSLHFFNVKGIPDEQFVAKKPKVGDIDTQVNKELEPQLEEYLKSIQGQSVGGATFIGFQRGNEQFSSLWELSEVPIKIQIDLEFVKYAEGKPTPWSQFSHSSSWEDLQAGVKGVFHKFLIQSLAVLSKKEFLLRKMVGRGKARAEQDVPTEDHMLSFAVSSKEGGGLRAKYEPVLDDQGLPLIKDGLQVMRALPAEGYEQDIDKIFLALFGDRLGPKQAAAMSKNFWSFTGLLGVMNQLLSPEEKQRVANSFINKLFSPGAQGLYKGDPERDTAEKTAATDVLFKTLQVSPPDDFDQMKADYKTNYKMTTSESVFEAIGEAGGEGAPNYKRQGIQHIYNPGSSTEMKDMDFIAMAKEIAANGGKLDGMAINLKADGAGIRFGKDESGRPFFMTSKVTEPKFIDNIGDFERYGKEQGQSADRLAFTKKYDDAMSVILNSDFIKALPPDTIVQAEMMYNPMAQQTDQGLKFVNIPYDPKKLGGTMTLVPFMFKRYSTGETLPDADKIKQKLLSMSTPEIKMVNNQLQQQGVDVSKIIAPVVNMPEELVASLTSRVKNNPKKEEAKQIITKARQELSNEIINNPNIAGKDQLGSNIEGLVVNLPSGRLAKVTSQLMKDTMAAKKTQAAPKQGPTKTAVVAIGSFVGHIGHEQLWNYTLQKAKEVGGDPYLFIGHGVGVDDPIPPSVKVQTWQRLYPEYKNNISTVQVEGGSLMQKIKHELINPMPGQPPKYDHIIIMVGEDQAKMNIAQALMKAVNKFPGYEHVKVELQPTPRGTGMSFTKLRNILKDPKATPEEQYALWAQGFDEKKLGKDWILHLMDVARKGMNVAPRHVSPSGAVTNMRPDDEDYAINYGPQGLAKPQKQVAERLFNSLMNVGRLDEVQDRMAGVGMGNYVVDKSTSEDQVNELDIKHTLNFIKKAHGGQLYGDQPYFTHPKSVAATGRKFFGRQFNNDAIKVAFLHDVVEDTNFSIEQLAKMGFSPEVVEAVALLTKDKTLSYADNIKKIISSGNKLAMMVKYADNYQNFTGDKSNFDPERADRLQKKYLASLDMLGDKLGIKKHISSAQATLDQETDEAMLPKSAFAGTDHNKLGPAAHLKGSMKRPARQGDLVGEEAAGVGVIASKKQAKDPRYSMSLTKDIRPGQVKKNLKAFSLAEAPIEMDPQDPMDPMIYGAGANPAKLKARMLRASGQLKDLAARAPNASPAEWQLITKQFDELKMNIEQIKHALDELAKKKRKGGIGSRGIDPQLSVDEAKQRLDPKCWKGYRKQGTKMKGNTRVNNCVKIGEGWEQHIASLVEQLARK